MKVKKFSTLIMVFIIGFSLSTQAADTAGQFAIAPSGGIILPLNGGFDNAADLKDVVNTGPAFGLGLRYGITNTFAIEGAFSFQWMNVQDDYTLLSGKDPAFVTPAITLNGIYNLGPAMSFDKFSPYLTGGVGFYPWKFTEDGPTGDIIDFPYVVSEEFSKTSFGFNIGAGIDYFLTDLLALSGGVRYTYVFAKDEDVFGSDLENQGFLKLNLGLLYSLPFGN